MEAALNFIEESYKNPALRLNDVASGIGLSSGYLDRLLTRETGSSFLVHLRRVRLLNACRLLSLPQLSVNYISFTVGYKHVVEFDRHFRRERGVTPTEWRRARNERLAVVCEVKHG